MESALIPPKPDPIIAFTDFVRRKKTQYSGIDGYNNTQHFIPYIDLRDYWTPARIQAVLKAYRPHLVEDYVSIKRSSLRIFSILVYINEIQWFKIFARNARDDNGMPLRHRPAFLSGPTYESLYSKIFENQWLFCPVIFDYHRLSDLHLLPHDILPLEREELVLRHKGAARVFKVKIHRSCNDLDENQDTFVIKTYPQQHEKLYSTESNAFKTLKQRRNEHILGYYGSFAQESFGQQDIYNLVVQFVAGGSLADYFEKTAPPGTWDGTLRFWKSLFGLFRGLHSFHQVQSDADNNGELRGVHEDIKADNILLSMEASDSLYTFLPILADFGCSHFRVVGPDGNDELGRDRHGSQIYGAPECSRHAEHLRHGATRIDSTADIWSAGCVVSEAATWLRLGVEGRREYYKLRAKAIKRRSNIEDTSYEGMFHDGVKRLAVVDEMHKRITNACHSTDDLITPRILELVEAHMLQGETTKRKPARTIFDMFMHIVQDYEHEQSPSRASTLPLSENEIGDVFRESSPATPGRSGNGLAAAEHSILSDMMSLDGSPPPSTPATTYSNALRTPSRQLALSPLQIAAGRRPLSMECALGTVYPGVSSWSPSSPRMARSSPGGQTATDHAFASLAPAPTSPRLTIAQCSEWRRAKKSGSHPDPYVHERIGSLLSTNQLNGREYLFLIDDTESLRRHKTRVEEAFSAMAYLAKKMDKNGIELGFASQPDQFYRRTRSDPLTQRLQARPFNHRTGFMEVSLGKVVNDVILRLPARAPQTWTFFEKRPISIFIFTDGRWGNDADGACGVQNPIRWLMDVVKERRLPRTHVMVQFIRFGDDPDGIRYLKYLDDFGKLDCDIVDTKPITDDVTSIFVGSLTHENDNNDDNT